MALWIEDYAPVLPRLRELSAAHGADLAAWLAAQPAELQALRGGVGCVAANDRARALLGRGNDGVEAIPSESPGLVAERLAALAGGARYHRTQGLLRTAEGAALPVIVSCSVPGEPPDHSRVVTCRLDARERRTVEGELRRTSTFLDAIVENIPDMVFVKEASELRFVRFNRAGEELLGIPRDAMYGKNDYDFFPQEEAEFFTAKDREVLASGAVLDIPEEPIHTASQGVRWLHTKKVPLYDEEGNPAYLLGISEDVTELRAIRQDLVRRTEDLERSNRDLEQFAYVASHDLHEPLRTVSSFVQLLLDELGPAVTQDARRYADFVQGGVARMRSLIDGLLELSRVGRHRKPHGPVALAAVLGEVRASLQDALDASGATFTVGELPTVWGDALMLRQLVQNLIANAVKFRRPGVPLEIRIQAAPDERGWQVDVEDSGIGFPQQYAEQIFGIFKRLHPVGTYEGSGIGLAVCRRIVQEHGGRIWASSAPGGGATFCFTLPAAPGDVR